jgi:ATP-dependent helicase HrpA
MGNVGFKSEEQEHYLGARGIKFYRHPGVHLSRKTHKWVVCAELVETTRLYGRGMAQIDPLWLEGLAEHLLKRELLDPKFDAKRGEVIAYERATLYGLLIYSGRKVAYARADMVGARELFIRQGLVQGELLKSLALDPASFAGQGHKSGSVSPIQSSPTLRSLAFLTANQKMIRRVQELEHKSRRQDVLVDEELIYAFYDKNIPAHVYNLTTLQRWYQTVSKSTAAGETPLLSLTQEELMRHEAQGVTTESFPKTIKLGGVDCSVEYLHEPGHERDGMTVNVPLFVLNQVSEERAQWLVQGMLKEKILALLKSLHQKPRARLVPLPLSAQNFCEALCDPQVFANGSLIDALQNLVITHTQVDVKRGDFKLETLSPHHLMNFRVQGEGGRQLMMGRNLGAIKAALGPQARGAFQALAQLKLNQSLSSPQAKPGRTEELLDLAEKKDQQRQFIQDTSSSLASSASQNDDLSQTQQATHANYEGSFTQWTFGELPELLEIRRAEQVLIGFPALIDEGSSVRVEVFDEPGSAKAKHQAGLRRLFALQMKDSIKYLEKNTAELPSSLVMGLGQALKGLEAVASTQSGKGTAGSASTFGAGASSAKALSVENLKPQIIDLALQRTFMMHPWPLNKEQFEARLGEGRARLNLITAEIARTVQTVLGEFCSAARKLKDTPTNPALQSDVAHQLQRLVHKDFLLGTPYPQLQHFSRYLRAVFLRLDKYRVDPQRDLERQKQISSLELNFWREWASRQGAEDLRLEDFRWQLEELRVSLFAQELKTPQPVSVKRLERAWAQLRQ